MVRRFWWSESKVQVSLSVSLASRPSDTELRRTLPSL
ncbi:Uncharacterised protein [Mycobacterium tuberculosis]|nr:Uncharacterised protein [Mycobacterium tuberculosis]